jgi:hypothetical protein
VAPVGRLQGSLFHDAEDSQHRDDTDQDRHDRNNRQRQPDISEAQGNREQYPSADPEFPGSMMSVSNILHAMENIGHCIASPVHRAPMAERVLAVIIAMAPSLGRDKVPCAQMRGRQASWLRSS